MQDKKEREFSILCVDDEQGILESYLQVLTGKGDVLTGVLEDPGATNNHGGHSYRVFTAESGEEAVRIVRDELAAGNRFAAGFFDIRMPGGMDGYETIKRIRELDPEMYCAVVTAYTDRSPEQIRKLFTNGFHDHFLYFNKPFSAVELEQAALFLSTGWARKMREGKMVAELRQAKNDWEDVFNTIDEAITIHDLDFNIIRSNNMAQSLLGLDREQIGADKCYAVFHGRGNQLGNCPSCETARKGIATESRFYEPHLGRYVEIKALPRFDDDHKLYGIIHVAKDITEWKKAEQSLRESEQRFRELAELLPVAVFEMDMNANLTFGNQCAVDYFGYDQQDLEKGVSAFDLLVPEDRARAQKTLCAIADSILEPALEEYEAVRKSGETFPVVFRTALIARDDGSPSGFRGVIMDISEKKKLETRLFQSQKIEAVGTLAGGIAHDFNNILTGILGYAELLQLKTGADDPSSGIITEIINGGKRAANLVKQILTFSRQDESVMMPTQVLPVLNEALRLLRATIPTTIEIRQDIAPECERAILMADQTQLHQIVMNLCTNAFHAMREQGGILTIGMSIARLEENSDKALASSLRPGDYLRLVIADTGKGISEKDLGRIFEPYFTTKKRGEGTGLGLAVTNGIVKKHGGDIFVESEPGIGTTFEIYLPLVKVGAAAEQKDAWQALPGGSERILFIDDEPTIVSMSTNALRSAGYNVTGHTGSVDALAEFEADPGKFDLVITDMTMPHIDGVELSLRILEKRPDMPIILCTGFSENISKAKARELGIRRFLQKPVSLMDIAGNVRELLDIPKAG